MKTLAAFTTCVSSGLGDFGSDMGTMLAEFGGVVRDAWRDFLWLERNRRG